MPKVSTSGRRFSNPKSASSCAEGPFPMIRIFLLRATGDPRLLCNAVIMLMLVPVRQAFMASPRRVIHLVTRAAGRRQVYPIQRTVRNCRRIICFCLWCDCAGHSPVTVNWSILLPVTLVTSTSRYRRARVRHYPRKGVSCQPPGSPCSSDSTDYCGCT
jgi:hypothetical protein